MAAMTQDVADSPVFQKIYEVAEFRERQEVRLDALIKLATVIADEITKLDSPENYGSVSMWQGKE